MRSIGSVVLALALLAPLCRGQCSIGSAAFRFYGAGCNPVFASAPVLSGSYDATNCTLSLSIQAFSGCCNTFLSNYLMAFGAGAANVPLPQIGNGCALLVNNPFAILLQSAQTGGTFRVVLPPGMPPATVNAQGAAHYFTTIGFTHDLALSDAAAITFQ